MDPDGREEQPRPDRQQRIGGPWGNETHGRDAFFSNLRVCFQRRLHPCKLALDREDLSALRVAGGRGKGSGDAGGAGFGVLGTAGARAEGG